MTDHKAELHQLWGQFLTCVKKIEMHQGNVIAAQQVAGAKGKEADTLYNKMFGTYEPTCDPVTAKKGFKQSDPTKEQKNEKHQLEKRVKMINEEINRNTTAIKKLDSQKKQFIEKMRALVNQHPELQQVLEELQRKHQQTQAGTDRDPAGPSTQGSGQG